MLNVEVKSYHATLVNLDIIVCWRKGSIEAQANWISSKLPSFKLLYFIFCAVLYIFFIAVAARDGFKKYRPIKCWKCCCCFFFLNYFYYYNTLLTPFVLKHVSFILWSYAIIFFNISSSANCKWSDCVPLEKNKLNWWKKRLLPISST